MLPVLMNISVSLLSHVQLSDEIHSIILLLLDLKGLKTMDIDDRNIVL
jgi:hypothetical protein